MFDLKFQINTHNHYLNYTDVETPFQHILYSCTQMSPFESVQSPATESINTAQLIANNSSNKILIPLSGGIDSETTALSFLRANIDFTPLILKFSNEMNDFDTRYAFDFCKKNKLNPLVFELDLDWFFSKNFHLEYAEKYFCRSPQLAILIWLIENTNDTLVFSYNPLPIIHTNNKLQICPPPLLYHCLDYCFFKNSKPGIGLFHLYTYEQMISFFKIKLYQECLLNPYFYQLYSFDNYVVKSELYKQGGFDIEKRPAKWTGFEKYRHSLNKSNNYTTIDYFDTHYRVPMEKLSHDPNLKCFIDLNLTKLFFSKNKTD